jgi:hypothetical protein
MKVIRLIILLFCCFCFFQSDCQNIDSSILNKLVKSKSLNYVKKNGDLMSEKKIEASLVRIIFYSFRLNKAKRKISMEGRVIDPSIIGDSVGVDNDIFLATPIGNRLVNIRSLGSSHLLSSKDSLTNKFPFRIGDFKIEFKFTQNDRLYFDSELSFPIEYDIGKLMKMSNVSK